MAGRVLKIDVVVDENGQGRRALGETETGVQNVTKAASNDLKPALDAVNGLMGRGAAAAAGLDESLGGVSATAGLSATSFAALTTGIGAAIVVAGAAGAAIYELGGFVKDASEYYVEQSGVLDINRDSVEHLADAWHQLKFDIGEVIVGQDGDFRSWIDLLSHGVQTVDGILVDYIVHLKEEVSLVKELASAGSIIAGVFNYATGSGGNVPGLSTAKRNADGTPTPYGFIANQQARLGIDENAPTQDPQRAEQLTQEYLRQQDKERADAKREQIALEHEAEKAQREHQRAIDDSVKSENALTEMILRSKAAYDAEIEASVTRNRAAIDGLTTAITDGFAKMTMSAQEFAQFKIVEDFDAKVASVDTRAANAAQLIREYQAQKELALIQLKQSAEGLTDEVYQELLDFQSKYRDVMQALPEGFEAIVPPIEAASSQLSDKLTSDMDAVKNKNEEVVHTYVAITRASSEALRQAAAQTQQDAIMTLLDPRGGALPPNWFAIQQQNAAALNQRAGFISQFGYAPGGVVGSYPRYLAIGGPAGTDTVPTMLTPGEGVLSRTGMAALDRLNRGDDLRRPAGPVTVTVTVDARGAQFENEAAIDRLADKVQQRMAGRLSLVAGG